MRRRGGRLNIITLILAGAGISGSPASYAAEIVTYSYDAQGRMIDATHTGTGPNSGLDIQYQYDLAGNRATQTVTGSKNTGQQVVLTPLGTEYSITPINP